jgi:hypothetical protein
MIWYLYSSANNLIGIDEYIGLFEVGNDGYCERYMEISSDGTALKYSQTHPSDKLGQLPEGNFSAIKSEIFDSRYGTTITISKALFESFWLNFHCINFPRQS